jgi:transcriptional regulator with XRE-family HTH domain
MPASHRNSCLAVLRFIAGITQEELANMAGCARVTIQAVELGRLSLSPRLAERIALQTGVNMEWLLANNYKASPTSQRDPREPFTKRDYEIRRAEIADPRTGPGDLAIAFGVWNNAAWQLASCLLRAYRKDQSVYFYYKVRKFLEELNLEFPPDGDLCAEQSIGQMASQLKKLLQKAADDKRHSRSKTGRRDKG